MGRGPQGRRGCCPLGPACSPHCSPWFASWSVLSAKLGLGHNPTSTNAATASTQTLLEPGVNSGDAGL